MTPLLHSSKTGAPKLISLHPPAAMPGGEVELTGTNLQTTAPAGNGTSFNAGAHILPRITVGDTPVSLSLSRPTRTVIQIPEGTISGDVVVHCNDAPSNPLDLRVAVPMAENLHPVGNPAVDVDGNVYVTFSGSRGQSVPVSVFSIARDFQMRPFVRDLLNATGLAFDPAGYLYVSSRAEGTVYRVSPEGAITTYAEGMGIATGIAFDRDGNLYVGDRSGTIFKVGPDKPRDTATPKDIAEAETELADREIFVFATLEPSISAYHLAFDAAGILYVSGPTTSGNNAIYAIDRDGQTSVFYQGLGRPQGMAFDVEGNLYIAASLHGQRGIVRITPAREASLAVSGGDLVGIAFLEDGCAALATRDALYHVALDIEGRPLI